MRAFVVPALRKEREERGTQFIGDVGEVKSLGYPPEAAEDAAEAGEVIIEILMMPE